MSLENSRINKQKKTLKVMITLYCNKNHNTKNELCPECTKLLNYANNRLEHCKFRNNKPNCGNCKIHCYKKEMKEKIIRVMKYSGPRLLIYHPLMALEHLIDKFKYKS